MKKVFMLGFDRKLLNNPQKLSPQKRCIVVICKKLSFDFADQHVLQKIYVNKILS